MMKFLPISLMLSITSFTAHAHDEGHGPKLSDVAHYGGLLAPVIDKKDMDKGHHATVLYKAELVRSADATVRVYFFTKQMKLLDTKKLAPEGMAYLETKTDGSYKQQGFALKLTGKSYLGIAPMTTSKPYNIDVHLQIEGRSVMVAFDNLD